MIGAPWYATVSAVFLVGAMALAMFRLVRGPSAPDRVVALDLVAIVTAGLVVLYMVVTGEQELLGPALVLSLVGFLGTIAFARFIERQQGGS